MRRKKNTKKYLEQVRKALQPQMCSTPNTHTHRPHVCFRHLPAEWYVFLIEALDPQMCVHPQHTHTHTNPMWMCFRCSPSTSGVILSSQSRRRQSRDRRELSLRRRRLRWIDCRRRTHFSHMSHPTLPISHILICFFEFRPPPPISPICRTPLFPYLSHISPISLPYLTN